MRWCDRFVTAALLSLSLLASGCGGGSVFGGPKASAPPVASGTPGPGAPVAGGAPAAPAPQAAPVASGSSSPGYLSNFFSRSSANTPQPVAGAPADVECPYIQIREGAATLVIGEGGADSTGAMSLKYQGTFVRAARQCSVVAGQLIMKVGVEGRIVLGPAGGPGNVDVPLRIAVVDESTAGTKPIVTRLIHIPVMVQSATDNPTFAHVEDGLSFPLPPSSKILEHYLVYIGFDPLAAEVDKKPAPKSKRKPEAKATPGTG
jgi:hypothetical protein